MGIVEQLDAYDREHLLIVIESSLKVRNAKTFFNWTQGILQALIPHEILICMVGAGPDRATRSRWYSSSRYFQTSHFDSACQSYDGLIPGLMLGWQTHNGPHFLLPGVADEKTIKLLSDLELRNLVGHGVNGVDAHSRGYFCFCRTTLDNSPRSTYILELLVPHVHAVFCRVLADEEYQIVSTHRSERLITTREIEILHLIKEGRTTALIAESLSLSPFTVRNHVKNILRKLNANSRSHAVAQAISQGIFVHHSQ
jgi:transcriptional regulator EpsA